MEKRLRVVITNLNDIIPDLSDTFDIMSASNLQHADALIVGQDITGRHLDHCNTAKEHGVPVFVVQHGRYATSDYAFLGKPPVGDYFLAWGLHDIKQAIIGGWPNDRVARIGSPIFIDKCKHTPDGKTVVYSPLHYEGNAKMDKRNVDESREIWTELQQIDGITPIAKLLIGEHNPALFSGNKFLTRRRDIGHIRKVCRELLSKTSCIVSQKEGTFELLAYSMGIPVIRLENIYSDSYFSASKAINKVNELEGAIREAIEYPELRESDRMEAILQTGGSEGDDPKKSIIELVEEVVGVD